MVDGRCVGLNLETKQIREGFNQHLARAVMMFRSISDCDRAEYTRISLISEHCRRDKLTGLSMCASDDRLESERLFPHYRSPDPT